MSISSASVLLYELRLKYQVSIHKIMMKQGQSCPYIGGQHRANKVQI